jgi:GDPmannose 4,6-dehydratase
MFGQVLRDPQDENTPFNPMSPYAVSKCAAHYLVKNYRIAYGMECVSGILFNHESELRGREFVTRKITSGLARIANGDTQPIKLGNCDSKRDWGYAPDYVDAMQAIIEDGKNTDYVVATNSISSVRDFFILSANVAGFNAEIEGEGVNEKCVDTLSGRILYEVDEKFFRPSEVAYLRGDNRKIFEDIGWSPSTSLSQMCEKMVSFDMDLISGSLQFDYTV